MDNWNVRSTSVDRFDLPKEEPAERVDKQLVAATWSLSFSTAEKSVMYLDVQKSPQEQTRVIFTTDNTSALTGKATAQLSPLIWNWEVEHEDRKKERKADAALHGATPFEVDRKLLKDVVREKMGVEVGRIKFLSAGQSGFHFAGTLLL